jgi:PadR family transcriptional regulator PadR
MTVIVPAALHAGLLADLGAPEAANLVYRSDVYGNIFNMSSVDLLQGTLDLMILQTLVLGPAHGHTIAHAIEQRSEEVLQVEHGSLYPALHRLEYRGWISSYWSPSENNRKARFYKLTAAGRRQLAAETTRWDKMVRAVNRVLRPVEE